MFSSKTKCGWGTRCGSSGMVFRVAMIENAVHFWPGKVLKHVFDHKTPTRYRLKLVPSAKCVSRRRGDVYIFYTCSKCISINVMVENIPKLTPF